MTKDFVYLASASPRRRALLGQIGIDFEVTPADIDEQRRAAESAEDYVVRLAREKAAAVWRTVAAGDRPAPVLAADTIVVIDGEPVGKPADAAAAAAMLARLSGRAHQVITAVAVLGRGDGSDSAAHVAVARSEVRFRTTTVAERNAYCRTGEPLDKAGGYGIQGLGAVFIEHLSGSYSAVMGLPLFETVQLLSRFGLPTWLSQEEQAS